MHLRAARDDELARIAEGMRATLVEVEGEATGTALYDMAWLLQRARQHLQAQDWPAAVLVAEAEGELLGHSLVREEPPGEGLVATTYVWPTARRRGVAAALLAAGEAWMHERGLRRSSTWTSATNLPLIRLYEARGYGITQRHVHETTGTPMVCLSRALLPSR